MHTINKALTVFMFAAFVSPAFADTAPSMDGMPRLAIGGYDTVAISLSARPYPVVWTIRLCGMTRAGNLLRKRI
jgi:hypothetical protein